MPNTNYPRQGSILSLDTLRRTMGGKSDLYEFLSQYATRDVQLEKHEVTGHGGIVSGEYWTLANSAGSSAANFAPVVASGGYIEGDSGTTDNGSVSLRGPIIYSGDQNCGMEVRLQIDDITEANFEFGFIDATPGSNGPGISNIDTPAMTASDGALIAYDTANTITTFAFATDGSVTNQNVAATTFVAPASTVFVNDKWLTFRIQIVGNFAACWTNGILAAVHDAGTTQSVGALEGGVLLAPWFYARTREAGVARFPRIQYMNVWQDRVA